MNDHFWSGPSTHGLRALAVIFALKYWTEAVLWIRSFDEFAANYDGRLVVGAAVAAAVVATIWSAAVVRLHPGLLGLGFLAILTDASLKMIAEGPFFANHFLLEAVVGIVGLLAVAREYTGESKTKSWFPIAILPIAVWGIAAVKKLLLGTYVTGEYLAFIAGESRSLPLRALVRAVATNDDGSFRTPQQCCYSGQTRIPLLVTLFLAGFGAILVLAEFAPVAMYLAKIRKEVLGGVLLVLSLVATAAALELDFGLTNLALATFWTGRRGSLAATVVAVGFAAGRHFASSWS